MDIFSSIASMDIIKIFLKYWMYFLTGTRTTVILSIVVVLCGSILGSVIALMKISKYKLPNRFASAYISIVRGTPLIVQLWIVYIWLGRVLPPINGTFLWMDIGRTLPAIAALSFNSAAYIAEVIRAGIQAVDKGQDEAARCIGMTQWQAMRYIIFPQAIKNILPAIGNEFVTMIKETAIIQYLGVQDLMYNTGTVITSTYKPLPPYFIAAIIYYILNYILSKGISLFERRLKAGDSN